MLTHSNLIQIIKVIQKLKGSDAALLYGLKHMPNQGWEPKLDNGAVGWKFILNPDKSQYGWVSTAVRMKKNIPYFRTLSEGTATWYVSKLIQHLEELEKLEEAV